MSDHEFRENNSSSFTFGLVLGLIIGAIAAIVIYRNNKNKVIVELKQKLTEIFGEFMEKAKDFSQNFSSKTVSSKPAKKIVKPSIKTKTETPQEPEIKSKAAPAQKKMPKTFVRSKK